MSQSLPSITHLQFLILEALSQNEQAGRELRQLLIAHGIRNSAPAFYQMMSRLEDAGLVEGWYEQQVIGGQPIKERRYRPTRRAGRVLADTRSFYRAHLGDLHPAKRGHLG